MPSIANSPRAKRLPSRKHGSFFLKPKHPQNAATPSELDRAKTALRQTGRIVFDATVTDGPAGRGLIKVDSKNMTPAEVLSLAQTTGNL